MPDSDGDGLPDEYEEEYGCDPTNPDTDGDGFPDGYEILTIGSNPADANSLDDTISDGAYDNDQDGLSNYEEYQLGTDPLRADSDFDGLTDGDETNVYTTDPLKEDTDEDSVSDGDEVALGLNPLVADSDGDGVLDNEEVFSQKKSFAAGETDETVQTIDVAFEGTGYIESTTSVESVMDTDWMCSNVVGLIGEPYDITSDSQISTGTITFHVDQSALGDIPFANLKILWYNEEEQRFVEMETVPDVEASTLTTTVEHFSKYLIVDCSKWYAAWSENNYPITGNTLHTAITIDCSSSMVNNDPNNYRITAANSFVDVMTAADLASVIFFADGADENQELTNDKEALQDAIKEVFSAGTTNYESALRYSIDSLEKQPDSNADDIIIFLSDGRPTNVVDGTGIEISEDEFDYSLVDEAASKGIRIYTIGLTNNVNENILKEMARRTNGEYYYANTAEELISYFLTVNMGEKYDITTDADEDGIPDLFETYGMPVANGQILFSDPENTDSDGDGLLDGEEVIMHIVDNADEVKAAYNYMYDYIPDIFISDNGGIYFTMVADPENEDTDGDGIIDTDEVKIVGEDGIAERYGIENYDDYEYVIDSHYYDYESDISLLSPLNVNTLETQYLEFKDESMNNSTNPIYYTIDGNEITVQVHACYTGIYDEELNRRTRKEIVKEGILENWNNEFVGTVYDFYPGLPINIEFEFLDRNEEYNTSTERAIKINITNSNDRSGAVRASFSSKNNGSITMRAYDKPEKNYKQTAAHEFGHVLGLGDAYAEDTREFINVEQNEIIGGNAIMCHNGRVVTNDTEMALYSFINDEQQAFSPSILSEAIRERQLYQYSTSYSVENEPYDKNIEYIWYNGKGYIPKDYVLETTNISGIDFIYFKESVYGSTTISILGLSDESFDGDIMIPSKIENCVVTKIVDSAFSNTNINSVQFEKPDDIISIGYKAFYNCSNLKSIDLPDNISILRYYTFTGCIKLTELNLPQNCKIIQHDAFYQCSKLTSISIPKSVETIEYNAFQKCMNLKTVNLYEGLKEVGSNAFGSCIVLESVVIPSSVTTIGAYAFLGCGNLQTITFKSLYFNTSKYNINMFPNNNITVYVPLEVYQIYASWLEAPISENKITLCNIV